MFLCKVAEGAAHRTTEAELSESQVQDVLRDDANSIVGLSSNDGGQLNYQETAVYRNEAAIPSYLIVYRL
eukprot:CAMPEP_0183362734 /NCGR_PEP_ID=MMETSP0164_2-20130417/71223_1 /TAXON_ID=221442 /ORGANISM="Coccolithus pelagicus ssp braarudi, Strain PLY182g" /LENGTH=69 /DNA_ID=CAMNT_0025537667 /DNA_START=15 /DNA_END=224 /DNA_ORIENTATION=-